MQLSSIKNQLQHLGLHASSNSLQTALRQLQHCSQTARVKTGQLVLVAAA
jgi:hypothetical protein